MSTTEPTTPDAKPSDTKASDTRPGAAKAAETRLADVKKLTEAVPGRGRKPTETSTPAPAGATATPVVGATPAAPVAPTTAVAPVARTTTIAPVARTTPVAPEAPTTPAAPVARANPVAPFVRAILEKSVMTDMTKATEGLFKAAEEAAEFGRGNAEAVAKATQLYVAGVQDLGKQTLALFQGLSENAIESAKAFSAVKSLKDVADLQASYARTTMEKTFAESAKLQETALKLAETSFAPLSARMTLAVEKFSKPLAA
jgi:phasin family protein